jgi:hypothetical protein
MKELTKDMKLKPKKNWMSGLTDEELQQEQQQEEERQYNCSSINVTTR